MRTLVSPTEEVAYTTAYGDPYPKLPYPQTCTCQNYPTHQALDCHVHNEEPVHLDSDGSGYRPCTCHCQSAEEVLQYEHDHPFKADPGYGSNPF